MPRPDKAGVISANTKRPQNQQGYPMDHDASHRFWSRCPDLSPPGDSPWRRSCHSRIRNIVRLSITGSRKSGNCTVHNRLSAISNSALASYPCSFVLHENAKRVSTGLGLPTPGCCPGPGTGVTSAHTPIPFDARERPMLLYSRLLPRLARALIHVTCQLV
jgi:hypothetical protein